MGRVVITAVVDDLQPNQRSQLRLANVPNLATGVAQHKDDYSKWGGTKLCVQYNNPLCNLHSS
jgi:hypothetical protein